MELLNQLIKIINMGASFLEGFLLTPVARVPVWLSITVLSAILGILLLMVYKHTSNQEAIAGIRDDIKVNILAIKLFRESTLVPLKAQVNLLINAFKLLFHSLVPMMVMIVPVSLILVQMGLWYQYQPVTRGDVIVKLELNNNFDILPYVMLQPMPSVKIITGPVRIISRKEVYWKIKPLEDGYHNLVFRVGDKLFHKSLAAGNRPMRLSAKRPGPVLMDRLFYPIEPPFEKDSIVSAITIQYPKRNSRIYGSDRWILYLFFISMISAVIFKPLIKVRL